MYNDKFRILEFGMGSGANAEFVTKQVTQFTNNFEYIGYEQEAMYSKSMDSVFKKLAKNDVKNFELKPQDIAKFKKPDNKADLIIASNSLSYCTPDEFYPVMQNLTSSVKNGGVLMGDLYLKSLGPSFLLNAVTAFEVLGGLIDNKGEAISQTGKNSVFEGFDVKAQLSKDGSSISFIATNTGCEGTNLSIRDDLVSNPTHREDGVRRLKVLRNIIKNETPEEDKELPVKEENVPNPLVQRFFESEEGKEFLNRQLCANNNQTQNTTSQQVEQEQLATEQQTEEQNIEQNVAEQNTEVQVEQAPVFENPDAWSVHFNEATDRLPKGNKFGKPEENLQNTQEVAQQTQNDEPVQ